MLEGLFFYYSVLSATNLTVIRKTLTVNERSSESLHNKKGGKLSRLLQTKILIQVLRRSPQ